VARVVFDLRPGSPRSEVEQEVTMPKGKAGTEHPSGTVKGGGSGAIGSAYGPNPSGKPAGNIHGQPAAPTKKQRWLIR